MRIRKGDLVKTIPEEEWFWYKELGWTKVYLTKHFQLVIMSLSTNKGGNMCKFKFIYESITGKLRFTTILAENLSKARVQLEHAPDCQTIVQAINPFGYSAN